MARIELETANTPPGLRSMQHAKPEPYVDGELVSIIMPTMGRTGRAVGVIHRVHETTDHRLEWVFVVDEDTETPGALVEAALGYKAPFKLVWSPVVHGLARSWNRGLRCADGGVLVFFADDLTPRDGWLDAVIGMLQKQLNGYGLVGFNDTKRRGKKEATHYLVSRQFLLDELNGCMGFEHYHYACNDSEACRRALQIGRYVWAKDAVVAREPLVDETKKRHFSARLGSEDIKHMQKREKAGFPNDFEPAIVR